MSIIRRVEYLICCDGPNCHRHEAANWNDRASAERAALRDGWVKCSRGRLLCPSCKGQAEAMASVPAPRIPQHAIWASTIVAILLATSAAHGETLLSTLSGAFPVRPFAGVVQGYWYKPEGSFFQIESTADNVGVPQNVPFDFGVTNGFLLNGVGDALFQFMGSGSFSDESLFMDGTSGDFTYASDVTPMAPFVDLRGLNLHLSRVEFETTAYGFPNGTEFAMRFYGDAGALPEPTSLALVIACAMGHSARRRRRSA